MAAQTGRDCCVASSVWVLTEGLRAPEETICKAYLSTSLEEESKQNVLGKKVIRTNWKNLN